MENIEQQGSDNTYEPTNEVELSTAKDAELEGLEIPDVDDINIDNKAMVKVDRIRKAWSGGDINPKMLKKAARIIGISEDEARRRLEAPLPTIGSGRVDPQTRADKRKKNKQSRASRKNNRG